MRFAFVYLAIFATCFLALGQSGKAPTAGGLPRGDQIRIRPVKVGHGYSSLFDLDLTVDADGRIAIPAFDLELDVLTLQPEDAEVIIRSALRGASDLTRLDLDFFATRDGLPLPGQHCVTVGGIFALYRSKFHALTSAFRPAISIDGSTPAPHTRRPSSCRNCT